MAEPIPIFRNNLVDEPINLGFSKQNINNQLEQFSQAAQRNQAEVLKMSLQDSALNYQSLAQQEIASAFESHPSDPGQLTKVLAEKQKALMRGVPLGLRNQAMSWFNSTSQGFISKARSNEVAVLDNNIRKQSLDNIDFNQKQIRLYAGNVFDEDPQKALEASTGAFTAMNNILGSLDSTGSNGRPIFTADQQFNITKETQAEFISSSISQRFESLPSIAAKREFLDNYVNGDISIPFVNEEGQRIDINPTDELTNGQFLALGRGLNGSLNAAIEREKKLIHAKRLQEVINGTAVPDPADPEYVKVVNEAYSDTLRPAFQQAPIELRPTLMLQFAKNSGVVPQLMKNEMKAWVESGDEEQLRTAVSFISEANNTFPLAVNNLNQSDIGKAVAIDQKLRAGVPFDAARAFGENLYSVQTGEVYRNRQKEFAQVAKNKGFDFQQGAADAVKSKFLFLFGGARFPEDTIIGEQASLDFRELVENYYVLSRDWDHAVETARTQFENRWGLSPANKNKVMLFPPEQSYISQGLPQDWIRKQLVGKVTEIKELENLAIDPESAILVPDATTKTEVARGQPPSYQVLVTDTAGFSVPLSFDNKEPLRFMPDLDRATKELNEMLLETREARPKDPRFQTLDVLSFFAKKRAQAPEIRFLRNALSSISDALITPEGRRMAGGGGGPLGVNLPSVDPGAAVPDKVGQRIEELRREKFLR